MVEYGEQNHCEEKGLGVSWDVLTKENRLEIQKIDKTVPRARETGGRIWFQRSIRRW